MCHYPDPDKFSLWQAGYIKAIVREIKQKSYLPSLSFFIAALNAHITKLDPLPKAE